MRPISHCLNKQLADLCEHSVQLEELSSTIARLLPDFLAPHCQVGNFNKGCLIITTSNASWASQLRYHIPELRDCLRKEHGLYQLSSIKIDIIEPLQGYKKPKKYKKPELSAKARETIISESQECGYQPLKQALIDLAKD